MTQAGLGAALVRMKQLEIECARAALKGSCQASLPKLSQPQTIGNAESVEDGRGDVSDEWEEGRRL